MTENSPSDNGETPASETPQNKPATPRPGRKGTGNAPLWLALLVLCLLLVGAGYGGWYWWQDLGQNQQQRLGELESAVAQLSEQLRREQEQQARAIETAAQQMRRQLADELEQMNNRQRQALNRFGEQLDNTNRRLRSLSSADREDWKLAEAEYLLRLANQRMLMERDGGNALALAQEADKILRDLNHSDLFPIRRALARDISALKLIERIDREGLYLQLLALSEQLDQLPLVEPLGRGEPDAEPVADEASAPGEEAGRWQRIKYRVAQSFRNLQSRLSDHLRIRRHDEPVQALLSQSERQYLRQNLNLMLEQAQVALLREQTEVYRVNLLRAADWLEQHYALNPQSRAVREQLQALADTPISQTLPDMGQALALLQAHVERLHRLGPAEQESEGENGA